MTDEPIDQEVCDWYASNIHIYTTDLSYDSRDRMLDSAAEDCCAELGRYADKVEIKAYFEEQLLQKSSM